MNETLLAPIIILALGGAFVVGRPGHSAEWVDLPVRRKVRLWCGSPAGLKASVAPAVTNATWERLEHDRHHVV
jgi:hypothetical protein